MTPDPNVYNCIICDNPLSEWHVTNHMPCCSKDCYTMMKFYRQRRHTWTDRQRGGLGAQSKQGEKKECVCCGRVFVSRNSRHSTCSPTCSELRKYGYKINQ